MVRMYNILSSIGVPFLKKTVGKMNYDVAADKFAMGATQGVAGGAMGMARGGFNALATNAALASTLRGNNPLVNDLANRRLYERKERAQKSWTRHRRW